MSTLVSFRRAFGIVLAVAFLFGCSANQGGLPIAAPGHSTEALQVSHQSTNSDLLYVVDPTRGVYMFTYPGGEEVGLLRINASGGLCSDKKGDVFITDARDSEVFEYAHGGTSPIATLNPDAEPYYCSVDPESGNLATLNSDASSKASVSIFKKATGKPKKYFDTSANLRATCSYDDKGNLYIGASTQSQLFVIAELPKESNTFITISVDAAFRGGNFLQWDGKHVAVTNAAPSKPVRVLQVAIAGSSGNVVKTTKLQGSLAYVKYFWIQDGTIVTPRGGGGWRARVIGLWKYPAGGKTFGTITLPKNKGSIASGITISRGVSQSK